MSEHDCNDCGWYNAYDGKCMKPDSKYKGTYRYGYEDACDQFEDWEDMEDVGE